MPLFIFLKAEFKKDQFVVMTRLPQVTGKAGVPLLKIIESGVPQSVVQSGEICSDYFGQTVLVPLLDR